MSQQTLMILAAVVLVLLVAPWVAVLYTRQKLQQLQLKYSKKTPPVLDEQEVLAMRRAATARLEQAANKFVDEFDANLRQIAAAEKETLSSLSAQILEQQTSSQKQVLAQWQQDMAALRNNFAQTLGEQNKAVAQQVNQDVEAYKQNLIKQFDRRLDEVVVSFIQDALGRQADLGGQMDYLMQELEANKTAIKEDLLS